MTSLDDLDPDRDRGDEVERDTGDERLRGRHPAWFERGPGLTDYHPDEVVEVDDDA